MRALAGFLVTLALLFPSFGAAQSLKAYKEKLFSYPKALEKSENGEFIRFDYRVERDIHDRDEIRGAKVRSFYVSMRGRKGQDNLSLKLGNRKIDYARTGKVRGAKWIVVYLHGQGGDRRQGISDWNFGGNFNRLKNLSVRNNGLYVVPTITNFEEQGAKDVAALLRHYASQAPKAKLILACGSMGGQICWRYMAGTVQTPPLAGVIMLATFADNQFLASPHLASGAKPLPLVFGHGTLDGAFAWEKTKALFDSIQVARPDYPVRMRLFNTGKHGTPIRMIDWRQEINWILSKG
ncbi:MAG: alpha/beta hydrolase [Hyphomicrobiales bacterium]